MSFTVRPVREEPKPPRKIGKYAILVAGILEGVVHMYQGMKQRSQEEAQKERRVRILKRTVAILLSGLFILLLLIGSLKILVRLKAISLDGMVSAVSATLPQDQSGFTNILLLGTGDAGHDGVDLTDTVMVVSLDPAKTKSAVMLSIPRDTEILATAKMGKGRINSLYRDYKGSLIAKGTDKQLASTDALKQLTTEVGTLLGLEIHGAIKLNFSGFEQAIDAIGGIDVVVPSDIVDTEYPGPNYSYETFSIKAGTQHLDGATALKYARSRHSTSDFSRSGRQQQIIAAASEKARKMGLLGNVSKITDIMSIVARNMESTFSARELLGLVEIGKKIDHEKIVNLQLSDQSGLYGGLADNGGFLYAPPREQFSGASVLLPISIPEFPVTWKQIRLFVQLVTRNRSVFTSPSSITILNAGAKEGSARKLGNELIRYGFNVVKTDNYAKPNPSFDQSAIGINPIFLDTANDKLLAERANAAKESAALLGQLLGISNPSAPESAAFAERETDLVIVLGKDYTYAPLQNSSLLEASNR